MNESSKERKRLGLKIPRSTLLPPYLLSNPYFIEYADAMDDVYGQNVDEQLETLQNIRNMWVQSPETETFVDVAEIIPRDSWPKFDRDLVVKQVNMLGLKLQSAGIVTDDAYQTISRFVGIYWFEKGTQAFMEFINYCLSSDLRVFNMWTEDYDTFYNEGESEIGTPIWEGGTWYPTTHVTIVAKGGFKGLDILTLQQFFYEIANYNLVLRAIDANFDMWIVPDYPGSTIANIVAMAIVEDRQIVLSNFVNRGAMPPPMHESEQLPSTYHLMTGYSGAFEDHYLLAQPTGWTYLDDELTMKVPVYDPQHIEPAEGADIGVKLLGNLLPSGQFNLLYGPVQWMKVPGSSRSSARIPYYGTGTSTIEDGIKVSAKAVGLQRTNLLVNPTGFFELAPGQWVPYW